MKNMDEGGWLSEAEIPSYLFFHAHFFARFQKYDFWLTRLSRQLFTGKTGRIYDAGCGTGGATFLLGKFFPEVIGIDSSQTMLRVANNRKNVQKTTNVQFICANMTEYVYLEPCELFSSSLVHILGVEEKVSFLHQLVGCHVQRIYLFIPEVISNPNKISCDLQLIMDLPCRYYSNSYTVFQERRHYFSYGFYFQNTRYDYTYIFEYLTINDMYELASVSGLTIKSIHSNPVLRIDYLKNMTIQDRVYVLESSRG